MNKRCIYSYFLFLFPLFVFINGCQENNDLQQTTVVNDNITTENPLDLQASSNLIELSQDLWDKEAVIFTWKEGRNRGENHTLTYLFKMDISGRDFITAIPTEEIGIESMKNGIYSKSFTHKQLNDIIARNWKNFLGGEIKLDVRVIAKVYSEDRFVKPDYSTITFGVKSYLPSSVPLFLVGSAIPGGGDLTTAIPMDEVEFGDIYKWRGNLNAGSFKILFNKDSWLPSYNKGLDEHTTILRTEETQPDDRFLVNTPDVYSLVFHRYDNWITLQKAKFQNVYYTGAGNDWSFQEMDWDYNNPDVFFLITKLPAGLFKFSYLKNWDNDFFMPIENNASITNIQNVEFRKTPDAYWKVNENEVGMYKIILDTKKLTIEFKKLN